MLDKNQHNITQYLNESIIMQLGGTLFAEVQADKIFKFGVHQLTLNSSYLRDSVYT